MRRYLIFGILAVIASGCAREVGKRSTIRFEAPSSSAGTMAVLPVNQKACYGVSIKGGTLNSAPANTCSPPVGLVGGYVVSGQTLELEVPKGSGYTIDLYLYLMDVGDSGPCPPMSRAFTSNDLNHVYHVGTAPDVNLTKDQEEVTISAFFPGLGLTIASNFSPGCLGGPNPQYKVTASSGLSTNGTFKLHGMVGRVPDGQVLSNGMYKIVTK